MPWVKIDDRFTQHPKVAAAGPLAMAMQVAGLCYCNRELTDGFIPRAIARTLLDWQIDREDGRTYTVAVTCGMGGDDLDANWVIGLMVESGMWEEVPGGYQIHDYLDFQPSREQVERERELNAKRQSDFRVRKHESKRNAVSNGVTNGSSNASSNGTVTGAPVPVPVPLMGDKSPKPPTARKTPNRVSYSPEFDAFWQVYPSGHGTKKVAYAEWERIAPDEAMQGDIIAGVMSWIASDRWRRGYVKDAERFLKGRMWENPPPPEPTSLTVHDGGNTRQAAREDEFARWRRERNGAAPVDDEDVIEVQGVAR